MPSLIKAAGIGRYVVLNEGMRRFKCVQGFKQRLQHACNIDLSDAECQLIDLHGRYILPLDWDLLVKPGLQVPFVDGAVVEHAGVQTTTASLCINTKLEAWGMHSHMMMWIRLVEVIRLGSLRRLRRNC